MHARADAEDADDAERDWSAVAADDGIFRAEAASAPFDADSEVKALHSMLDGESSTKTREACVALGLEAKFATSRALWEPWRSRSPPAVAEAVQRVVKDLEADHLRPVGMFTLLQNMRPAD